MSPPSSSHFNLFVATSDPRRYLPRSATEVALVRLERRARAEGMPATLLTGPSGMGKSLLLRVFAQRMRRMLRTVAISGLDCDAPTFCTLVLDVLRQDAGDDPERALLFCAADWEARGSALLLAIDDVERLPLATAGRLGALAETCSGLRIVAATSEPRLDLVRALGANHAVELSTPMDLEETQAFVRAALADGWATPEVRALFDGVTVAKIHRDAGGIPGEVNRLAAERADAAVREGFVPEPGRAVWKASAAEPKRRGIVPL